MRTGISVPEARALVLEQARPLTPEVVAFESALGRVLAEDVRSSRTLPPADCSAMDGYAVRAADVARAGAQLRIAYEVAAGGRAPRALGAGEAARIFTGAPLPPGADAVVRQEDTEARAGEVRVLVAVPRGESVREAGEDVKDGDLVLQAGARIGPAEIGMLAALGRTLVHVHRRPRVAVLSGGDELVEPHEEPSGGRIVSSNAYSIAAQCREAGALPNNLGIARDTPGDLERLLRSGLGADVLVSSAGVSVGDHDHVRPTLEKLGVRLVFWGVEMKPGYPIAFGRAGDGSGAFVFGLPGNPVSAMVTFELFVRPLLLALAGRRDLARPELGAIAGEAFHKKPGREHYVRVFLARRGDEFVATATGNQSSGVLRSMTLADGLLVFAAGASEIAAGARARVLVLDERVFARADG
ncbi:MAG TPA: gephyrin-like molybdotransferase Glp [Myxococcota bacterium]|nr:gephyrin-like molybdotransferase Glp [Myxococcota bacterium]